MNNLNPKTIEFSEKRIYRSGLEFLLRTYRGKHRVLDKEVVQLTKKMQEFNKATTLKEAKQFITEVSALTQSLQAKTMDTVDKELDVVDTCKRRADHLKSICSVYGAALIRKNDSSMDAKMSKRDDEFDEDDADNGNELTNINNAIELSSMNEHAAANKRGHTLTTHMLSHQRANKLLMDHLISVGYYSTAIALAKSVPGLWQLSLIHLCEEAQSIEMSLRNGSLGVLNAWLEEVQFRLKTMDWSEFKFDMVIFEFYLLIKKGLCLEALEFARQKLVPMLTGQHDARFRAFREAMSLLAVRDPIDLQNVPLEHVGEDRICHQFRALMRKVYGLSYPTPFALAIQLGLSNLKLPDCFDERRRKIDCLVCYPSAVNAFSRHLPSMRHYESRLYCWYTGKHMNENNRPMLLPNGYVYSREAVDLLTNNHNEVRCPRSNRLFKRNEVHELYVI